MKKSIIVVFCLLTIVANAQKKPTKIKLQNADVFEYIERDGEKTKRLIGNVSFKHENVLMSCDSAFLYSKSNTLDAYGNVKVNKEDGLKIVGDFLKYKGDSKLANIKGNVILTHDDILLSTTSMNHDITNNIATYTNWGEIIDKENVLTSRIGIYYADNKDFFFKDKVTLKNPKYNMTADTLRYNTDSEKAFFLGPTTITSDENTIYCENGWYDTKQNLSQFNKHAKIFSNSQSISGDSLFYDRDKGYGKAISNVEIWDTIQNLIIRGDFAEYFEKKDEAVVSENVLLINIYEDDSLFLHADTLRSGFDTTGEHKILLAYNKVRFYKPDLQGKCDSMVFFYQDSTIHLFSGPIIWSEQNQMTADFISLKWGDGSIESLSFENNSFIVSEVDSNKYNQIKGKNMLGSFLDNELRKIKVTGNGETVYFVQEEDSTFVGVNKAICSDMMIYVEENNIKKITFIKQPASTLYPIDELSNQELELKGFIWFPEKRPLSKADIFIWK